MAAPQKRRDGPQMPPPMPDDMQQPIPILPGVGVAPGGQEIAPPQDAPQRELTPQEEEIYYEPGQYDKTIAERKREEAARISQEQLDQRARDWGFADEADRIKQINKIIAAFGKRKSSVARVNVSASREGTALTGNKGILV